MTVPRSILARGKQGFDVSLERWFGEDFGRLAREVLFDPRARARGWRRTPRNVVRESIPNSRARSRSSVSRSPPPITTSRT